ncbi:MAG: hypothetical protein REV36_03135 [Burkholderia sp.]|nr:hypothetical protein [Burkholderia sp.]
MQIIIGSIVLTTSNKSDIVVGCCTLHSDIANRFAVIKDMKNFRL